MPSLSLRALPFRRLVAILAVLSTVVAIVGAGIAFRHSVAEADTTCAPYSSLPCDDVPVTSPYTLDWNADAAGLADGNGVGTGFTMVQPSNSTGGAYKPERIAVDTTAGTLTITSTAGIQYKSATTGGTGAYNQLDNGLGVGLDTDGKATRIETSVVKPNAGTNHSEQAGLWFGPDQDNYVKLAVVSTSSSQMKVQLAREIDGNSKGAAGGDEFNTAGQNLSDSTVHLALRADATTNSITGSYSVDGGTPVTLGTFTNIPNSFFDGSTLSPTVDGVTSYAGIFTTHRSNTTTAGIPYTFGDFSVSTVDSTPPAAPAGLDAEAGDGQVKLTWTASSEKDLAGYNVYRSESATVDTTGTPLNGATPLNGTTYTDTAVLNDTTYHYAIKAVDTARNASQASATVSATPKGAEGTPVAKINFQPDDAPVPTGYTKDIGAAYDATRGYGWVTQDSLSGSTHEPLDLTKNTRDRARAGIDPRLNTLIHMQYGDILPVGTNGTATPGAWEYDVPNGTYRVTATVGDQPGGNGVYDSKHTIRAEGTKIIDSFQATAAQEFEQDSATVDVTDGRLTIDAIGGTNTKLDFVEIVQLALADTTAPAAPSGLAAAAGDGQVKLTWTANTESDLDGYNVYRGTSSTVDTTGTPLNGDTLVSGTSFTDDTAANGTTYFYAVTAVDTHDNASAGSASASATPAAAADTTAPAAPQNLDASNGSSGVALTWDGNGESDLAGYNVYRSQSSPVSTSGTPLNGGTLLTTSQYVDDTAQASLTYHYVVVAVDTAGNASDASDEATVEVTPTPLACQADEYTAEYFDNTDLSGTPVTTRCEDTVGANYGEAGPAGAGVGNDNFSGRWTQTRTLAAGEYHFSATADDGVRVYVDGEQVIDGWKDQGATTYTADRTLTAGTHTIVVEYYEHAAGALLDFTYGMSSSATDCAAGEYLAEYFDNNDLTGTPIATRCEATINADYGEGHPAGVPVGDDNWSVRWTQTRSLAAGDYTFTATADDGIRVLVDGAEIVDGWFDHGAQTFTGTTTLSAGTHSIVVEYYEHTGSGMVKFGFSAPPVQTCADGQYTAEYFDNRSLDGTPVATRCEDGINYDFGGDSPTGVPVGQDDFSVRWTQSRTLAAGDYTFTATADDGVRVLVDGTPVIDEWQDQGATKYTGTRTLAAGEHTIVVEYYEHGGGALVRFAYDSDTPAVTCPTGQYLAEYYNNRTLEGDPVLVRCEDTIDHDYGMGHPADVPVGDDNFSVRWTQQASLDAGDYTFLATSDDGIRVQLDGALIIDQFTDHGAEVFNATRTLAKGEHTIVVEYYEHGGGALARFGWNKTGGDTTAPLPPANLAAVAGNGNVQLSWTASAESDLAGYNIYRGTSADVDSSGTPLNGNTPFTTPSYTDSTVQNGTTYYYVVTAVDTNGNESATSLTATATPQAAPRVDADLNFQPDDAPVPSGFTKAIGEAYDAQRGYGWVTQDTASSGSPTPLDLRPNTRDRNRAGVAQELDTLIHLQYGDVETTNPADNVTTAGAFEYAVPNGTYEVSVSVGDQPGGAKTGCPAPCYDSVHNVRVEGVTAIDHFQASASQEFKSGAVTVTVTDGLLTVDAIGGTNTKLNYVRVHTAAPDTVAPAAPTGLTAIAGDAQVALSWTGSSDTDVAGYNVYRAASATVPTTTPINSAPLTSTSYVDSAATNGTHWYYVVTAVDRAGNESTASATVDATPNAAAGISVKVNFSDEATTPPAGYVKDFGEAYGARTGSGQGSGLTYGWVKVGTNTPVSLVGNGRNRNTGSPSANQPDLRLATMMHMQLPSNATGGVNTPGSWELSVPNGAYTVTVAVGDAGTAVDSDHWLNIEDQNAIAAFVPTVSNKFATATRTVVVSDGRLTLSPESGTNTKIDYVDIASVTGASTRPSVLTSTPANLATGISTTTSVVDDLRLPNGGVDPASLSTSTVKLTKVSDGSAVPGNVETSGGGDTVNFSPTVELAPSTLYRFEVTSGVKDNTGKQFLPFSSVFTTGADASGGGGTPTTAAFDQVPSGASGQQFTSMTKGPDGKLYAATLDGKIFRYTIAADGTLTNPFQINTVREHALAKGLQGGMNRTVIGLTFDPKSTAANPILWISDNYEFVGQYNVPDLTSFIAKLTGPNLENYTEVVSHLPRSVKDHEVNSIAFGPDGKLYFTVGAMNAMGQADSTWGNRVEHMLSAAVLQLDVNNLPAQLPIDSRTPDVGGSYNPYAPGAPLKIYATGNRNTFDIVWHSNGHLYAPTNGSAAGGSTPATPSPLPSACQNRFDQDRNGDYTGPSVPGITNNGQAQTDFVYDVHQGRYYGHPNPARCEWVLDNGNPTSGADKFQVDRYPVGTQPDRNYDLEHSYDAGLHASADGAIEYKGDAFGGSLDGKLLVIRYSAGQDIETFDVAADGTLSNRTTGITGFTGFSGPLDLAEDNATGNIYVSELNASKITLLRPQDTSGNPNIGVPTRLVYNDVRGGSASAPQTVTIRNTGSGPLTIPAGGLNLTGSAAGQFTIASAPSLPVTIAPGGSIPVGVAFNPTNVGPMGAALSVTSNDPSTGTASVTLRGLGTLGQGGSNEPSLQWILDTWQIPVNVGDPDPSNNSLPTTNPLGPDEVDLQRMVKAEDDKPISVDVLAMFGPTSNNPAGRFGWYGAGNPSDLHEQFTLSSSDAQSLHVSPSGTTTFDPGPNAFGLYSSWPAFGDRNVFGEDTLNTWDSIKHHVRAYPMRNADGSTVPNAYVLATEETTSGQDYQDIVVVVRNVKVAPVPNNSAVLEVENLDGVPYNDRLVFSRIQTTADGNQKVHDVATLRIHNSGSDPMHVNALPITGPFELASPPALPATVAAGGHLDVPVRFTATSGGVRTGTLIVQTDAGSGTAKVVELAGFWQSLSENGQEPTVHEIAQVMGWTQNIPTNLNENGTVEAVGDEILSPYWQRADSSEQVSVRQIQGYHTYPNGATVYWTEKNGATHSLFGMNNLWAQSLLPPKSGSTTAPAATSFTPSASTFGFKIDGEWSDDTRNNQSADKNNGCTGECGHHVRFWPVKDRDGKVVPNTYYMVMDYSGINYDYNDNGYLITNIKPAVPSAPTGLAAVAGDHRVTVSWSPNPESGIAGYNVYRGTSSSVDGTGTPVNGGSLVTGTTFLDTSVSNGTTYYYVVRAVYGDGTASAASAVATATPQPVGAFNLKVNFQNAAAPVPSGYVRDYGQPYGPRSAADQGTGLTYGWVAPGTATPRDLSVGGNTPGNGRDRDIESDQRLDTFMHMQADDVSGTFNGTPLPGAWELAVANGTYAVTVAVGDPKANNYDQDPESHTINVEGVNAIDAFVPTGGDGAATHHKTATVQVTVSDGRLTVDAIGGTNTKIDYVDIAGISGDESAPATPAGLTATASTSGISLDWANNGESDLLGYNVYRAASSGGTYTKLTGTPITSSSYVDTAAPAGATSYYRVTAVDTSDNESGAAAANAERPDEQEPPATSAIRINAGGSAQSVGGTSWSACSSTGACSGYVSGGFAYSESDTISGIPSGMNNAIFQSEWTGGQTGGVPAGQRAFGFDVPVADGSYNVRLHFAELNKFEEGARLFDVDLEGKRVLSDFDIYAEAGGADKAIVREFPVTVTDGKVTIDFIREVENAKVSAIEILPAPQLSTVRINAGGPAQTADGTTWAACSSTSACDGAVSGGLAYSESDTISGIPSGMNNTIFQSEWTGGQTTGVPAGQRAFGFDIPVKNGSYKVRLHFAELNKFSPGTRVFDVDLEGKRVLSNFDIYSAAGGADKAIVREFPVTVTDGKVTIDFIREVENAKVSAIEILPGNAA